MEMWQNNLLKYSKGTHTIETMVLGHRLILTEDPENIKAILGSQFEDYGLSWLRNYITTMLTF